VIDLLKNPAALEQMAQSAGILGKPEAADQAAQVILQLTKK